ncbi:ImmA/IrrE family metallo-endopeptidase [bacterium]|nr:ImmA/IrrE family metallo-endopeptidase [bacterium]
MSQMSDWAAAFAARHGLTLIYDTPLPGGVPAYKYEDASGAAIVVLDESMPAERQHFSLAHEAAHVLLDHRGDLSPDEEFEANKLASELLLPDPPFSDLAYQTLRELKDAFPHASFEAIARRRLQFVPGVLTVMDNGKVNRRVTSDKFNAPLMITPAEKEALTQCMNLRKDIDINGNEIRLHATFVDDGRGVERVLLLVEEA